MVPGWIPNIEMMWGLREMARFLTRLAGFGRWIVLDERGVGLSDRTAQTATLEDAMTSGDGGSGLDLQPPKR